MNLEERIEKIVELYRKATIQTKEGFTVKVTNPVSDLKYR